MIPIHDDNPTSRFPWLTLALIAACTLTFLWQLSLPERQQEAMVYSLGVIPAVLFEQRLLPPELALVPPAATLVTSMFLHGGLWHLLGNMLFLWIFGNNVEDQLGPLRYLPFYLLSGLGAAFTQALPDPQSTIPMIGASGAISGVLGAYLLLFPFARVLVVIPIGIFPYTLRLPAVVVLGLWFAMQFLSSLMTPAGQGGVAWGAHVGGFVAGMVLIVLLKPRNVRFFQHR